MTDYLVNGLLGDTTGFGIEPKHSQVRMVVGYSRSPV